MFASLCIAGTHSGVGKTTLTLGILAALRARGLQVQPFKCGPDFIDPGHHRRASGVVSRNLDGWMMGEEGVMESYARASGSADVAVVEGVMGLFDGASSSAIAGSTAHVCRMLDIPIVLVVNAKAMARSVAALVKGFVSFEEGSRIVGVVANNVSSERHAEILREALESASLPPLLGTLPTRESWHTPERHLGLVAESEESRGDEWFAELARDVENDLDLDLLLKMCEASRPLEPAPQCCSDAVLPSVRIGIARDEAFHFYYEDNLDMLRRFGAELISFSPLHDNELPPGLDGLYIGGGFPEMFAQQLSANKDMRSSIKSFADQNGHIYAECGGFMYLCRQLTDMDGNSYDMCGALPAGTTMESRLNRLGYIEAKTVGEGLFGPSGTSLRGHEFHWSSCENDGQCEGAAFDVTFLRRKGHERRGIHRGRVWASYSHLHFASNPDACRMWVKELSA